MAYLHCHGCGWQQDDFWSEDGYNPFRNDHIEWLKELLFRDEPMAMDKWWIDEAEIPYQTREVTEEAPEGGWKVLSESDRDPKAPRTYLRHEVLPKHMVVHGLRRMARSIENMMWRTEAEWKAAGGMNAPCPRCGESHWDID